jgi:hypothetical protein
VNFSDRHGTDLDFDDTPTAEGLTFGGGGDSGPYFGPGLVPVDLGGLLDDLTPSFGTTVFAASDPSTAPSPVGTTLDSPTGSGPGASQSIVSFSYSVPLTEPGAAIGGMIGGLPGSFVGAIFGSMCGIGVGLSYVPSTGSLYGGFQAGCGTVPMAGGGVQTSIVSVPAGQNPNSIARGASVAVTYQPTPATGSTVVRSPGSGPPVVGVTVGNRVPVIGTVSYNWCIQNCPVQ